MCNSRFGWESKSLWLLAVLKEILIKGSGCWDKGSVDRERNIHQNVFFHNNSSALKRDNGPLALKRGARCLSIGYQWKHPAALLTKPIRTMSHMVWVNIRNQPVCLTVPARSKPTLSPPRFLLHQCTLMKGNAPTVNPVMLHSKRKRKKGGENHDRLCCDKGDEQNKSCEIERRIYLFFLLSPPPLLSQRWKKKKKSIKQ